VAFFWLSFRGLGKPKQAQRSGLATRLPTAISAGGFGFFYVLWGLKKPPQNTKKHSPLRRYFRSHP
jgi:hypothetical protein